MPDSNNAFDFVGEHVTGRDFGADGDVDLDDFALFADCLAGPDTPPDPADPSCVGAFLSAFDWGADGDVELLDFGEFCTVSGE